MGRGERAMIDSCRRPMKPWFARIGPADSPSNCRMAKVAVVPLCNLDRGILERIWDVKVPSDGPIGTRDQVGAGRVGRPDNDPANHGVLSGRDKPADYVLFQAATDKIAVWFLIGAPSSAAPMVRLRPADGWSWPWPISMQTASRIMCFSARALVRLPSGF